MKNGKNGTTRLIWALDSFEGKGLSETEGAIADFVDAFSASSSSLEVEPAYVLSPQEFEIPLEFSPPWIKKYRPAAERALKQKIQPLRQRSKKARFKAGTVLVQKAPSLTEAAKTLSSYARKRKAEMILVGTHARKGLPRFFLGSFAETLILNSEVPVITVGPAAKSGDSIKKILFPTDLSRQSLKAFTRAVRMAGKLGAELVLLHTIVDPIEPVLQSGVYLVGGGWIPVANYLEIEERDCRTEIDKWVALAAKAGVKAKGIVDTGVLSVERSILNRATSEKADLIAMAAESGKIRAALVGSVTRQVVRAADRPVWILKC